MSALGLRIRLLGRTLVAVVCWLTVSLSIGFLAGSTRATAVTLAVLLMGSLGLALASRWVLGRWLAADTDLPKGMEQTLARLEDEGRLKGSRRLKVRVFQSPLPRALLVKSLLGSPCLYLSWAALSVLNEMELRAVIEVGAAKAREPGLALRSFSVCVATALLKATPTAWIGFFEQQANPEEPSGRGLGLGPGSAAFFLMVFPVVRVFLWLGRPWTGAPALELPEDWALGLRKAAQTAHFTHVSRDPAIEMLQFFGLPSGTALLAGLMPEQDAGSLSHLVTVRN